jgi:uncharacterized protein YjeT (DUF2065 family)
MSMTRETRRERVRRLANTPDAQVRIKWGTIAVLGVGVLSLATVGLTLAWMLTQFIDRL